MMTESRARELANDVLDAWEVMEEETLRDGHRFTFSNLIKDAILGAVKEDRKEAGNIY